MRRHYKTLSEALNKVPLDFNSGPKNALLYAILHAADKKELKKFATAFIALHTRPDNLMRRWKQRCAWTIGPGWSYAKEMKGNK